MDSSTLASRTRSQVTRPPFQATRPTSQATASTQRTTASRAPTITTVKAEAALPLPLGHPARPEIKPGLRSRIFGGDRLHWHHTNVETFWRTLLPGLDFQTTFVIRTPRRRGGSYALVVAAPVAIATEGHADRYRVRFLSADRGGRFAPGDEDEMSHHDLAEAGYAVVSRMGPPWSRKTYFRLERHLVTMSEEMGEAEQARETSEVTRSRFLYQRHYCQAVYYSKTQAKWTWSMQLVTPELMVPPPGAHHHHHHHQHSPDLAKKEESEEEEEMREATSPMQATRPMSVKTSLDKTALVSPGRAV